MRRCCSALLLLLFALPVPAHGQGLPAPQDWKAQVEADWLRQEEVRILKPMTTAEDAQGGCDGVKDGKWGFHTGHHPQPWWQVDLGGVRPIGRVVVFNRADSSGIAARASRLLLLLSSDGKSWGTAYQHNGTVFLGAPDNKPLVILLQGEKARFVRITLPEGGFLHLDEVEVYALDDEKTNLALWQSADQCSLSTWSKRHPRSQAPLSYPVEEVIERGRRLAADLVTRGTDVSECVATLDRIAGLLQKSPQDRKALYLDARWAVRRLALRNPLLDFDTILLAKRATPSFPHMSDQYYGWWSRPGGGIYALEGFRADTPHERCLTAQMPDGSFLRPDLSYDGKRVLFSHCKYHPNVAAERNKVDKARLPEDSFYHVFKMNVDGTGLRQLTHGRYDDFDARYLPDGEILFLSTRRGQFVQCGKASAEATLLQTALPDSYVRCGGDAYRPVAVYTLHVMRADGSNVRAISPFENFEWTPSVAHDGRILFARWDYIDRTNMPFMSLWSVNPDGTNLQAVYGNFTRSPHCIFEARCIPNSGKIVFTASAHHAVTGGSIVLLDPNVGRDGADPIASLTPEVCFPESAGWPETFYAAPYPLSERYYLLSWSDQPLMKQGRDACVSALGVYLYDSFGNLELLCRDRKVGATDPFPLRSRPMPPVPFSRVTWNGPQEGRLLLLNVYAGLPGVTLGDVKRLRIVGVPAKTQPNMNSPNLGITRDDPGKFVLGTVPVEADGSAYFRVPSGTPLFFQALDREGMAVQTMRTATYVQPNEELTCVGCHEPRNAAPPNRRALAPSRPPSRIAPPPDGAWPMRFDLLVQPVLEKRCVSCHRPDAPDKAGAKFDLTAVKAYDALVAYGKPSLADHVRRQYGEGKSTVGACAAKSSRLLALLREGKGHYQVQLDHDDLDRLVTWMDIYAQRQGSFSADQEERLRQLRVNLAGLFEK